MDRNALAELLQALESRRVAEERRREERYTALIERVGQHGTMDRNALAELLQALESRRTAKAHPELSPWASTSRITTSRTVTK
ncbi:UNVERIFIED_CONTAM: hypothetical protein FKN15_051350 [Acipenser sinensis]